MYHLYILKGLCERHKKPKAIFVCVIENMLHVFIAPQLLTGVTGQQNQ